ncbi:hypothetical protein DKX38_029985 [Salix brachista]|uniref:Uncharacterized protein n=1 Tax=Salix brachista TaxID=2182728 RepID=A0A5N5JCP1_9ROSI|nr:hypothetical protein DKX38_029985 [Salix brachista]
MSMRTRKIAPNMEAALASNDNRTHVSVYHWMEAVEAVDDNDEVYIQKKQKGTKCKTRQAKALENVSKAPGKFLEILHEDRKVDIC